MEVDITEFRVYLVSFLQLNFSICALKKKKMMRMSLSLELLSVIGHHNRSRS